MDKRAIIINDTSPQVSLNVVFPDPNVPVNRVTVKNSKLIGTVALGTGVVDGGGNTFFATRAAAGLAPAQQSTSPRAGSGCSEIAAQNLTARRKFPSQPR